MHQLRLWFDNFLDAAARDPTFNTSPSFQVCWRFVFVGCVTKVCPKRCRADRQWECMTFRTRLLVLWAMWRSYQSFLRFPSWIFLLRLLLLRSRLMSCPSKRTEKTRKISCFLIKGCALVRRGAPSKQNAGAILGSSVWRLLGACRHFIWKFGSGWIFQFAGANADWKQRRGYCTSVGKQGENSNAKKVSFSKVLL